MGGKGRRGGRSSHAAAQREARATIQLDHKLTCCGTHARPSIIAHPRRRPAPARVRSGEGVSGAGSGMCTPRTQRAHRPAHTGLPLLLRAPPCLRRLRAYAHADTHARRWQTKSVAAAIPSTPLGEADSRGTIRSKPSPSPSAQRRKASAPLLQASLTARMPRTRLHHVGVAGPPEAPRHSHDDHLVRHAPARPARIALL